MNWNELATTFNEKFTLDATDKMSSGPLKLASGESFYVLVQFHENGIRISKRFRPLFWKKLWIRWDTILDVDVLLFPYPLPESLSQYTDAHVSVRNEDIPKLTIPWRTDLEGRWRRS